MPHTANLALAGSTLAVKGSYEETSALELIRVLGKCPASLRVGLGKGLSEGHNRMPSRHAELG